MLMVSSFLYDLFIGSCKYVCFKLILEKCVLLFRLVKMLLILGNGYWLILSSGLSVILKLLYILMFLFFFRIGIIGVV